MLAIQIFIFLGKGRLGGQHRASWSVNCRFSFCSLFSRLIPLYMIFFVFYIGISPYLMVGPYDNSETQDIQSCKSNWWHNVLFLNNILGDVKVMKQGYNNSMFHLHPTTKQTDV